MKLESINNEKFALNPKEMSSLVGGESIVVDTGGGRYNMGNGWVTFTKDRITYANERDRKSNIESAAQYWT